MSTGHNIIEIAETAEDDAFTVKEFVVFDYIMALFFLFLFICSLGSGFTVFTIFAITGTAGFFLRGLYNRETLRIDCNGIYQNRKLVTSWDNFLEADICRDRDSPPGKDKFVLVLRYYKEGIPGNYRMVIALADTQNKSEQEVLEAIRRFYQLSREPVTLLKQPLQIGSGAE